MKKVLYSVYDDRGSSFDIDCDHYGPAITTSFKEDGKIIKTHEYVIGNYGKKEHLWRLRTEDDNLDPDQFNLF